MLAELLLKCRSGTKQLTLHVLSGADVMKKHLSDLACIGFEQMTLF